MPPLGLAEQGEHTSADEVAASEAVRLFVERAQAVKDDFALTDQAGESFSSGQLDGKVWIGFIFLTNCPTGAWRQRAELAGLAMTPRRIARRCGGSATS